MSLRDLKLKSIDSDSGNGVELTLDNNTLIPMRNEHERRIVTCVNVCQGIETDVLETVMMMSAYYTPSKDVFAGWDALIKQRDELVTALNRIATLPRHPSDDARNAAAIEAAHNEAVTALSKVQP